MKNKNELVKFQEHRFHEDDRRRGFYDIVPGLPGDMNFSEMPAGVIAGMHMHKKHTDYFVVAKGKVIFRLVSKSGQEERIVLSSHSKKTLIISPGIWHGYKSLEPSILFFYIDRKFDVDDEFKRPTSAQEWETEIK